MRKLLLVTAFVMSMVLMGSLAFGNPGLLPKHPGYPMGAFKDPVTGRPTANDPGQQAPSPDEALKAAAAFDDPHVANTNKEIRPNIVHDFMKNEGTSSTKADKR